MVGAGGSLEILRVGSGCTVPSGEMPAEPAEAEEAELSRYVGRRSKGGMSS